MRRGTTPTHTFKLPFDVPDGSAVRIVYAQNRNIILELTTERCEISGNIITVKLTAVETLLFDCDDHNVGGRMEPYPVQIQVGIKTKAGDALWSDIIITMPDPCLREDGVI